MIDEVLRVLEAVKGSGDGYVARCPAHEDGSASLSVKDKGPDDWPLLHCFTGCTFEAIRDAIEAKGVKRDRPDQKPNEPRTLKTRTPIDLFDLEGTLLCRHVRLEYSDGSKSFSWEMPDGERKLRDLKADDLIYGIEGVRFLPESKVIVITEGEKAAGALQEFGISGALGTVCGASATPSQKALAPLKGREVYLWPDVDKMGAQHMERTAKALVGIASSVKIIIWREAPQKGDAADWLINARTREDFAELLRNAAEIATPSEWPEGVTPIYSGDLMRYTLKDMEDFGRGDRPGVISTGFRKLDRAIRGGFEPGEVYLFGAPTGGGKTTLVQSMAARAAKGGPVLMVTPEMTLTSLLRRELVRRSSTREDDVSQWAEMVTREESWARFVRAGNDVLNEKPPLLILDKTDVSMDDVEAAAEQIEGLRLVLIDYAQQVADIDARTPRYLQVGDVALRAIGLAQRLRVPVVLASQVNVVTGKGKEATRSYSFRESSILEQKSAVVIIFDRKDPKDEGNGPDALEAQFKCHKNRHGYAFRAIDVDWWPWLYQIADPNPTPLLPVPTDTRQPYRGDDD